MIKQCESGQIIFFLIEKRTFEKLSPNIERKKEIRLVAI